MSTRDRKGDRQDVDTSVGRGDPGADTGPTAGHAGAPSTDDALALGGTREGAGDGGYPDDDLAAERRRAEDPRGGYGSGLETGEAALGSPNHAAARVDTFNVPGERGANDPHVPAEEADEYRGRRTRGEHL
jgi:hypothetical protein